MNSVITWSTERPKAFPDVTDINIGTEDEDTVECTIPLVAVLKDDSCEPHKWMQAYYVPSEDLWYDMSGSAYTHDEIEKWYNLDVQI